MFRKGPIRHLVLALGLLSSAAAFSSAAHADSPFSSLSGAWSGAGQIKLESGSTERLKCKAYYTSKDEGQGLGLAIICASASSKIELRATLNYEGGKVSGSWEERQFNAAGSVTGNASDNRFNLTITGGGFSGSMMVSVSGRSQSVSIQTNGIALRAVNINLSRG